MVTPTTDRPCSTEDAVGPCFWDAKTQGNGKGLSFWVLENGTVAHVVDYATAYRMYRRAYAGQRVQGGLRRPLPGHPVRGRPAR